MSEEAPKPQSGWSKPRYSIKQLLGCFGLIVALVLLVGGLWLYLSLLNSGMQ